MGMYFSCLTKWTYCWRIKAYVIFHYYNTYVQPFVNMVYTGDGINTILLCQIFPRGIHENADNRHRNVWVSLRSGLLNLFSRIIHILSFMNAAIAWKVSFATREKPNIFFRMSRKIEIHKYEATISHTTVQLQIKHTYIAPN